MWNRQFAAFAPMNQVPMTRTRRVAGMGTHDNPRTTHAVCACEFFGLGQQCAVPTEGISVADEAGGGLPDLGAGDTVGTIAIVGGLGVLGLWLGGIL